MTRSLIRTTGAEGLTLSSTDITVTSGDLLFGTSAKGVNLGVTSNTDANTLEDYEEGTFSPTLENQGNSNLTTTKTSSNVGAYVKIGSTVQFQMLINISALSGDDSSNLQVGNLPFTAKSLSAGGYGGCVVTYNSAVDTNPTFGIVLSASDDLRLYSSPVQPMLSSQLQATSYIALHGQYETAS